MLITIHSNLPLPNTQETNSDLYQENRDVTSYSSISLLSTLSKVSEKIQLKRLKPIMKERNFIFLRQSGFRSKHQMLVGTQANQIILMIWNQNDTVLQPSWRSVKRVTPLLPLPLPLWCMLYHYHTFNLLCHICAAGIVPYCICCTHPTTGLSTRLQFYLLALQHQKICKFI